MSDNIPGVTHIDNTCRAQTVDKSIPHLYNLLKEFKKITGHGILLNTSFNLAGQPLIENVGQAIDVLKNTSLDCLWLPEKEIIYDI